MNLISCDVCMDLMPLVKDEIACEESCKLVNEHIKNCPQCQKLFGEQREIEMPMDDKAVILKIKKQLVLFLTGIIFIGALLGMLLSDNQGLFYNALIMPLIGAVGYMLLKEKAYWVPIGLFAFSFVWISIREIIGGFLTYSSITDLISMSGVWSVIFVGFSILGVIIAWLLHYAFKKEGKYEN